MTLRATLWGLGCLIVPVLIVIIAQRVFNIDQAEFFIMMEALSETPWAIPVTIVIFCIMAFVGAPQWMLITGTVLAFGPWEGGVLSWIGSLAAAMIGFWIGRMVGAERLRRLDAKLIRRLSAAVRKNGFMTSLVVRLVPTGPAILVNLAAGVSRMKFRHFVAGTSIGIIPKIVVVALISQGLLLGLSGTAMSVFFIVLAVLIVLLTSIAKKRLEARSPV